jgi:hypothetical protein
LQKNQPVVEEQMVHDDLMLLLLFGEELIAPGCLHSSSLLSSLPPRCFLRLQLANSMVGLIFDDVVLRWRAMVFLVCYGLAGVRVEFIPSLQVGHCLFICCAGLL